MSERQRASLLRQLAAREIPDTFDRWPAIRRRIASDAPSAPRAAGRRRWATLGRGARRVTTGVVYALLCVVVAGLVALVVPFMAHRGAVPASPTPGQGAAVAQGPSYHLAATQHFAAGIAEPWATTATSATVERWFAGDGRLHEETRYADSQGNLLLTFVRIVAGHDEWAIFTYDGKTDVMHWAYSAPGTPAIPGTPVDDAALRATKQAMATQYPSGGADPTKKAAAAAAPPGTPATWTSLDATKAAMAGGNGTQPNAVATPGAPQPSVPIWDPFDGSNPTDLTDLLNVVGQRGCGTAERLEQVTVAGRAAYVVSVVSTGACPKGGNAGDRLIVRVDQQTFLTLGYEQYAADGTLIISYAVDSIAYGVATPDSLFAYTPPADAYVCDAGGAGGTPCRTKGPQRRGNP